MGKYWFMKVAIVVGVLVLVAGIVYGVAEAKRPEPKGSIIGGDTRHERLENDQVNFVGMFRSVHSISEDVVQQAIPISGDVSKLYVTVGAAPGAGNSYSFTMRKNGADTSLGCVVANAATTCADTTNSVAFEAGELISLKATPDAFFSTHTVRWTAKFTP